MKELMKKLMDAGKTEAFESLDAFIAAAKELGISQEEIDEATKNFDGFPLDDGDLDEIAGGMPPRPSYYNPGFRNDDPYDPNRRGNIYSCKKC